LNDIVCGLICTLTILNHSTAADINNVQARVCDCTKDVAQWCKSRRLQLNDDKTEAIWFGSRSNLIKLSDVDRSLTVSSATIHPTSVNFVPRRSAGRGTVYKAMR